MCKFNTKYIKILRTALVKWLLHRDQQEPCMVWRLHCSLYATPHCYLLITNSSKAPLRHRYVNMRSTPSSYLVHRRQIISPNRWKVQQIGAVPSVYDDRLAVIARAVVCGRLQRQRPGWGDWTPRDVRRHNRMLSVSDASNFVTAFWTATYYPPRIRAT